MTQSVQKSAGQEAVEFASIEISGQTLFSVRDARDRAPHLDGSIRANPPTAKASN